MNMKKLMAVVLAVVLAISAMAVNVFAAESEIVNIPLRPAQQDIAINASANYTMEVPMYNLYGYADMNSYLELNLPNTFSTDVTLKQKVEWYLEASGEEVLIAVLKNYDGDGNLKVAGVTALDKDGNATTNYNKVDGAKNSWNNPFNAKIFEKVYVNFGAFKRAWYEWANGTDKWATVPQTVAFNTTNSIKLRAKVTFEGWTDRWNKPETQSKDNLRWNEYANTLYTQLWTAGTDGVKTYDDNDIAITGSKVFGRDMNVTTGVDLTTPAQPYDYIINNLTWDMTLNNRATILAAESVDLVIKLANKDNKDYTYGNACYALTMFDTAFDASNIGQNWWNDKQNVNRKYENIDYLNVIATDGKVNELRFTVPTDKLVDPVYGFSAGMISTFDINVVYEQDPIKFMNLDFNYDHYTLEAYLEVTLPAVEDSTDINVDEPVESGNDGDNIDVTEPTEPEEPTTEPEDTNPPTGIVLAVLPMVVAAAAVVASKRR